jgi:CoA:oxalate CoA-transferase
MSALAHVRVLDLTRFLAGPFCTTMLADMGADVVKVEAPKGGDEGRYGYPPVDGVPVFFQALNRNKRGITLDLRKDEGRAILRRLLPHFDVLVENFAGGTLARWGLAPEDLCREHPKLVVASLSGFGQTGRGGIGPRTTSSRRPRAASCRSRAFRATRRRAAAARSATTCKASSARSPCWERSSPATAPAAARRSTCRARTRCSRCWTSGRRSSRHRAVLPRQVGNRHLAAVPYDAYQARDGWLVIAVASNKLFRQLCAAIGRPELGDDPRFAASSRGSSTATRSTRSCRSGWASTRSRRCSRSWARTAPACRARRSTRSTSSSTIRSSSRAA